MLVDHFKRVITTFADERSDVDITRGTVLVQVHDELIEARLSLRGGDLFVEEHGATQPAATWVINRLARLPSLAERLLAYLPTTESFVSPSGRVLGQPNDASGEEEAADALLATAELLERRSPGTSSVLYLTSDAGEGKTTLINALARKQAHAYKMKESDWLLVPIPLGGRTFLRFDDVVVAALVNRLKFPFLYYEAFLELVRLGVIVPAFDGFEEMIIETSTGDAISALGNLVRNLRSEGSILIAARTAYFDYPSFRSQAKLFDAIGEDDVAFSRIALERWNKEHFIEYAHKRKLNDAESVYEAVSTRLSSSHPVLTRAVLVRRLVDVALDSPDLSVLLDDIGYHPQDYFYQFVNAIVLREANEKWLDRSGEPPQPLLTVAEHHQLLSLIAQEMWLSSTDTLRADFVGVVGELFAEHNRKPPVIARQIHERIKQHSLLVTGTALGSLSFDHEDFRVFYLGEAIGRALQTLEQSDVRPLLQAGSIPRAAVDAAALLLSREKVSPAPILVFLQRLAATDLQTSFVRENAGVLSIALLTDSAIAGVSLSNYTFPPDSLCGARLDGATIADSYFQPTGLAGASISGCTFTKCRFERLTIPHGYRADARLLACQVGSVISQGGEEQIFDPELIKVALREIGLVMDTPTRGEVPQETRKKDDQLRQVERILRLFVRSTGVNEQAIKVKLGHKFHDFRNAVLPQLLRAGIFEETQYSGAGVQKRYRLGVPMSDIQEALAASRGGFETFIRTLSR